MTSGRANRARGARAEVAVVNWLRDHGYPEARRCLAGDGRQVTDVDRVPWIVEVKDRASSAWPAWCAPASLEAARLGRPWVVVRRLRGTPDVGEWPIVCSADALPELGLVEPNGLTLAVAVRHAGINGCWMATQERNVMAGRLGWLVAAQRAVEVPAP